MSSELRSMAIQPGIADLRWDRSNKDKSPARLNLPYFAVTGFFRRNPADDHNRLARNNTVMHHDA
jgi:hypothetical protein